MNWQLDAEPTPSVLVLPPDAASLDEANAAIEMWEFYSRKTLDPTQRLWVQAVMAERPDGRWAAQTTGRAMARQNGKGDELEVPEFWGLVQRSEAILHTIHDAVLLATQTQQRMLALLEHPDLRRKVKRKWMGTGQQMIEMRNGGIIWYRTRTGGGGRGVDDIDRLVIDEAQHATDEHLAAITPILFANSNPQLNIAGTAGLAGKSEWWWSQRIRALSGDPGAFAYMEHSAEVVTLEADGTVVQTPDDTLDRDVWRRNNPAIGCGRKTDGMEFLEEQLHRLGVDAFAQEHLCVWAPPPQQDKADAKIPGDAWAGTVSVPADAQVGHVTIAYAVSRDGEWSSIAVGSGSVADPYVEVIEHRQGVGWLPQRLVELADRWEPLAVGWNNAGPAAAQAGAVLDAFRTAGVDVALLNPVNTSDYKAACGGFYSDVVEGRLRRPDGQGPLDVAVAEASERPLGDAWAWDMRNATVPISPLEAVTIARALLPVEVKVAIDAAANVW
jgi:hypothetical protein